MGTGRELDASLESRQGKTAASLSLTDPWVPRTNLAATLRVSRFSDGGSAWGAGISTRERSVFDPWAAELFASRSHRGVAPGAGDVFRRDNAALLVRRRIGASDRAVTSFLFGGEAERTQLSAAPNAAIIGPAVARRSYAAVDLGLGRQSAAYDTLTWLLPKEGLVDVPLAFEGEALVGAGPDLVTGQPAFHLDLWGGRMWHPRPSLLIVGDIWGSGYLGDDRMDASTVRGALTVYRPAARGLWTVRLAAERLMQPDPDVRALATVDPVARLFPDRARLAEGAAAASAERSLHLLPLTRSWWLDGALFAAGSLRWDPVAHSSENLGATVVGAGLRLAPTKLGRDALRLDLGYPVINSSTLRRRLFVGLSISPWLEADRQRDGRRPR
jgi:hypothetical protein